MKLFEARDLLFAIRELRNRAGLVFESKDGPGFRLHAVDCFGESLQKVMALCQTLDLPMSSLHASQLVASIDPTRNMLDSNAAERIATMLSVTIENEVSLRLFFAVSPERSKYYGDNSQPFGDAVATAFPSVSFDAAEANRCYAISRNTASVFHLMRVLEIGLSVLAAKFGILSDHTNWDTIIGQIDKAIKDMDKDPNRPANWKDEREFYSQCASHFRVVKDAWRNYTAHARGKYDEQEALDMLANVRGFMQRLATRLHE